jgi:hypothetical protein
MLILFSDTRSEPRQGASSGHGRRWRSGLGSALAVMLLAATAAAQSPGPPASGSGQGQPASAPSVAATERKWFGLPLAAAYAAPLALIFVGAAVDAREAQAILGYAALGALVLPPVVHYANGDKDGVLPTIVGTVAFPLIGGFLGLVIGGATCDEDIEDDCFASGINGGVIGVLGGYVGWAAVDVAFAYSKKRVPSTHASVSTPGFVLAPYAAPLWREARAAEGPRLDGIAIGASAQF